VLVLVRSPIYTFLTEFSHSLFVDLYWFLFTTWAPIYFSDSLQYLIQ